MIHPTGNRFCTKRSLGQNFLQDRAVAARIVAAAEISPRDEIIEIGPGNGALTEYLLAASAKVTAIEADQRLLPVLEEKFGGFPSFEVIFADALKVRFADFGAAQRLKVVANLPYNISTAVLQKLSAERSAFSLLVLMFQREVVARITALPGDSERGFLTVLVERSFSIEKLFDVPATAFRPIPKITSSVIRLKPKLPIAVDEAEFRAFVSAGFRQKRKTLANNFRAILPNAESVFREAAIDSRRRAETLSLSEWETLFHSAKDRRN
ncbi:MAG: ribosomal RNA small subunit methyltransferase A [Blastocatellia bacterium]